MLSKEEVEKFEAEHKRVAHLKAKDEAWELVLRKPNRAEYKRFRKEATGDNSDSAQETLVRQIAVYPSRDALDALFDDYPGIAEACGKAIRHLCGIEADEQGK